ncbi:MAG TPA: choice-of-anchor Q domain-containing protein [bacterium]|nr:choice-of-anchor Q domain-containing protein [bacterium]
MRWLVSALLFVVILACEDGSRRIYPPRDNGTGNTDTDDNGNNDDPLINDGLIDDTDDPLADGITTDEDSAQGDTEPLDGDLPLLDDDSATDGTVTDDVVTDDTVTDDVVTDDVVTDDVVTDDTVTDDGAITTDDGAVTTDDGAVVTDDGAVVTDDATTSDADVDTCQCTTGACCDGCHFRSGTVCRPAVDAECDIAETCTGSSPTCPPDEFEPIATPCGDQTSAPCDDADACDGNGACDPGYWESGDSCEDGSFCNGAETCNNSGKCSDHPGNPCGNYVCSETQGKCCDSGFAGADCEICVRFVKPVSAGSPTGLSWAAAYSDIQAAIDSANGSSAATCEVWVAAGTYYIYKTGTGNTIQLRGKVPLYGGFAGTEWLRDGRNWTTNVTTIDGHQSSGSATQVSHVLTGAANAVVDGFTVTGGKAINGSSSGMTDYVEGGALYVDGVSMTLRNSTFTNNSVVTQSVSNYRGGAISAINGGTLTIERCLFSNNIVNIGTADTGFGGAIYATGSGALNITNSVFHDNSVSQTTMTSSEASGGAVNVFDGRTLTVTNTLFYDNSLNSSGTANGGAIRANDATITVTNSTFSQNIGKNGGAIANMGATNTTIVNSILYGNTGTNTWNNTRQLYDETGGGSISATYSDIEMTTNSNFAGTGNIHGDPLFVNAGGNDFHLKVDIAGSAYSPCIDTANDTPAPTTDLEGNARVNVPVIGTTTADMGCYEYQM